MIAALPRRSARAADTPPVPAPRRGVAATWDRWSRVGGVERDLRLSSVRLPGGPGVRVALPPALGTGLWGVAPQPSAWPSGWLTWQERAELAGSYGARRQQECAWGRYLLKRAAMQICCVDNHPRSIVARRDEDGRLAVSHEGVDIALDAPVSIAHAAGVVLVAVADLAHDADAAAADGCVARTHPARGIGIGVDVEATNALDGVSLRRFGDAVEMAFLGEMHDPSPLLLWCLKEAVAKALGIGFAIAPRRFRLVGLGEEGLSIRVCGRRHTQSVHVPELAVARVAGPTPAVVVLARVTWAPGLTPRALS